MALLSALILTALWLLAPSRSARAPEAGVTEISFVSRGGGPVADALDDAIRVFEEESDAAHKKDPSKPRYRLVSGQSAARGQVEDPTRFLVSVAGGMPPDVIVFDRYAVTEWAARGAFYPLDEFVAKDAASGRTDAVHAEDFYDSCWDEVVYRDPLTGQRGLYGIPEKVDNRALFYNKDLLKRAGYVDARGEGRPPKTWEELEEMGVKLTEHDAAGHITRLGFAPNYGNSWLYIYAWMNGGRFMSPDGKRCTLNDPKIVDALAWMTKLDDDLGGAEQVNAFQSTFQGGDLDPFIERRQEQRIVPAERVPDAAVALRVHFRERFEQVHRADVVPDSLHGATGIAHAIGVDAVVAVPGVLRRQRDTSALGQFLGVMLVLISGEADGFVLAELGAFVQAEHRGFSRRAAGRDHEPG